MTLFGRSSRSAALVRGTGLIAAGLLLASCSSGGSDSGGSSQASSSDPSQAAPSSSSSVAPSSSASSSQASGLSASLITATDVGSGFSGGPSQDTSSDPFPCTPNEPALSKQVPAKERAFATFKNQNNTVATAETIYQYAGESESTKAFKATSKGFTCSKGTLDGAAIKIVKRAPEQTKQGITLAAWDFTDGKSTKGTIIALRKDDKFIGLQFLAQGSAGDTLNVGTITDRAIAKLG